MPEIKAGLPVWVDELSIIKYTDLLQTGGVGVAVGGGVLVGVGVFVGVGVLVSVVFGGKQFGEVG